MIHKFTYFDKFQKERIFLSKAANLRATSTGAMSTFGGPGDSGVSKTEGLAIMSPVDVKNPKYSYLFELEQPVDTSGIARRLDAKQYYIAMRWDYKKKSKEALKNTLVTIKANGKTVEARPVDWGPAEWTGRIADISPGVAKYLGLKTNDLVTVTVPD